jgi:protein phosphatase
MIAALEECAHATELTRLDVAGWSTTGMVRSGNEDAFCLMHSSGFLHDRSHDAALICLADGMGGYEAGEFASALAVQTLREQLRAVWSGLTTDGAEDSTDVAPRALSEAVAGALRETNLAVRAAAHAEPGKRGMGCTAEVVLIAGRHVIVGHVGDSRTYHFHDGRLVQLTRDQTLVNRLMELGTLTPEEAAIHPRRSELQQALGGHLDIDPDVYVTSILPGDWLLVCSDGLTNHITHKELTLMLQSEATSAEMAARRLVNLTNLRGATDNATVVVVRVL